MLPNRIFAGFAMAAFLTPALAQTVDLPMRKEGLWQMSTTVSGAPATVSTLCMDKSFGREMLQMGSSMQKEMCSKNDISRDGDKVHLHSVCKFGDTTATSRFCEAAVVGSKFAWPNTLPNTLNARYAHTPSADSGKNAPYSTAGIR